jgi:ABC-type sugar transport system, periplasmic component
MKKILAIAVAIAFSLGAGVSAQQPAAKPVTLKVFWWGTQARHDLTQQALELYKKSHPNVSFVPMFQGYDGYFQKLSVLAASNEMPDIFQFYVGGGDDDQFIRKNLVEPLDPYIKSGLIDTSSIAESTLSTGRSGGKLYGMALSINAKAFIVDPEAYKKAGLTIPIGGYPNYQALEADLAKLKKVTGYYGADDFLDVNNFFPYYARQNGQTFHVEGAGIGVDEGLYTSYMAMKKKWVEAGLIPAPDVSLISTSIEQMQIVKGKSALCLAYTNQLAAYNKAAGKQFVLIPLPGPEAAKARDVRPGCHFSISARSANKEEAAKFISWFVNDVEANKLLKAERGMPVSSVVLNALDDVFSPEQKAAAVYLDKIMKASSPMDPPAPPGSSEIEKLMKDLDQQILFNTISIKDAYKSLKSEAAKITAKSAAR